MEKHWLGTLLVSELPLHSGPLCPQGVLPAHAGLPIPPSYPRWEDWKVGTSPGEQCMLGHRETPFKL